MLPRKQSKASQKAAVDAAKRALAIRGWSYRTAAPLLHVKFTHLAKVLAGYRQSRALLQRIDALPDRKAPAA
jgi:hypothetical protein